MRLVVAVNLSPLQFQKKNLAKTIKKILKKTQLLPEYLEVQIIESSNFKVIAEGVERKEHVEFLKIRRCDEIQGDYFSKLLLRNEFTNLLIDNTKLI